MQYFLLNIKNDLVSACGSFSWSCSIMQNEVILLNTQSHDSNGLLLLGAGGWGRGVVLIAFLQPRSSH